MSPSSKTDEDHRLRRVACPCCRHIGWRVHPDHRGEQTLGLDHRTRRISARSIITFAHSSLCVLPRRRMAPRTSPGWSRAHLAGTGQAPVARRALFRSSHFGGDWACLPAISPPGSRERMAPVFEHRIVDLIAHSAPSSSSTAGTISEVGTDQQGDRHRRSFGDTCGLHRGVTSVSVYYFQCGVLSPRGKYMISGPGESKCQPF